MNIVCVVAKAYFGVTPAGGAETYLHNTLKFLVRQGHRVTVFVSGHEKQKADIDGVHVRSHMNRELLDETVKASDLVITHLDGTPLAQSVATRWHKPLVQVIHNTNEYTEGFLAYGVDLAVYNSQWVSDYHESLKRGPMTKYWTEKGKLSLILRRQTEWPSIVLKPPLSISDYDIATRPDPDGYITIVNPCDNKGQHIFYELARRCPDLKFMAVVGGYQPNKQKFPDLPNVVKHEHVQDIRAVFRKTAVVVMPSTYESYGLVAVEAACSGIPSVVSSTPGLLEALGDAAGYVSPVEAGDFSTMDDWEKAVRYVLHDYWFCSDTALKRAKHLSYSSLSNLSALEKRLRKLVQEWA